MHRLSPRSRKAPQRQGGITLIESLVAIMVAALGILGILGVQMRTLTDTSTTVRRAQAIRLIEDLGERLKVNPNALASLSTYTKSFATTPSIGNCASGCDYQQLATYDLAVWSKAVRDTLPLGQAAVFIPQAEAGLTAGMGRQLGVMVAWRENERDDLSATDRQNTDATQARDSSGTFQSAAGSAATCPGGFTCHLQYIPVAARCVPYIPGGSATTYYCPGA
ncbi:MAG TPA: type IV pilus modification protein PilV [Alicycliphilus sp.]|nr:type IV pilus modification protein PilV [Alicycliphilus sp.]